MGEEEKEEGEEKGGVEPPSSALVSCPSMPRREHRELVPRPRPNPPPAASRKKLQIGATLLPTNSTHYVQ